MNYDHDRLETILDGIAGLFFFAGAVFMLGGTATYAYLYMESVESATPWIGSLAVLGWPLLLKVALRIWTGPRDEEENE